ncbi:DoxX family protein [Streptomyces liangshanensis]|uniref:DoxX family protein n=1 Tax=Streptomyces liangshanensis TaxID=2717324 RepID=A0A6G9H446_9ACTN|nr:DoxX family protein [Streptomyces liangshanensis]QIQ05302.1 DoxX family protein [Streptomyces liangshanensis]
MSQALNPITSTGAYAPSRRVRVTARGLEIVLALFFGIASASPKLVGHSSAAESFDTIGLGDWFMYLVGALELAGAVALLIPRLSGVAAIALVGLMAGAFVTQLTVFDGENLLTPLILAVPLVFLAVVRRSRTAELVAQWTKR